MLQQNIANMEERIKNSDDEYDRERAAMAKIRLLQTAGMENQAEAAISEYIDFAGVRQLRLQKLMDEKKYEEAIELIQGGIKVAQQQSHAGTLADWKDHLLNIYLLLNDTDKIISVAEDLFKNGRSSRKYYPVLKKYIAQNEWAAALHRLLNALNSYDGLKAEILIEHQMWDKLFDLCQKEGVESIEEYEKYLKPHYANEIFSAYHKYVEKQALITDPNSYGNVARVLVKMKKYEGGKELVENLVQKYRAAYKRRKNMIAALKDI